MARRRPYGSTVWRRTVASVVAVFVAPRLGNPFHYIVLVVVVMALVVLLVAVAVVLVSGLRRPRDRTSTGFCGCCSW